MPLPLRMRERIETHDAVMVLNSWCTYDCIDDLGYSLDDEYEIKLDRQETTKGKQEHGITYVAYALWFGDRQISHPMPPVEMTKTIELIIRTTMIARKAYQPRLMPTTFKQYQQHKRTINQIAEQWETMK